MIRLIQWGDLQASGQLLTNEIRINYLEKATVTKKGEGERLYFTVLCHIICNMHITDFANFTLVCLIHSIEILYKHNKAIF